LEKSATKNERVGKQSNTKLKRKITATEKTATGNRKLDNENIWLIFRLPFFQLPPFPLPFLPFTSCTDTLTLPSDEQQQSRI